jgi:death-on-curing protein
VSEPAFLSVEAVLELHTDSLAQFGGSSGIRDQGGLEAAIFHPQNIYFYARGDLYEMAAAYAFHIAEAQAFIDGNKRTAAGAALSFLEGNGIATTTQTDVLENAMLCIATKQLDKTGLAALLRTLFPA